MYHKTDEVEIWFHVTFKMFYIKKLLYLIIILFIPWNIFILFYF